MGAGSVQVGSDWFEAMHEDVAATGAFHRCGCCHVRPSKC
jgi:predicted PP-loop superfamily ATPase